jgi:hypothetical protein
LSKSLIGRKMQIQSTVIHSFIRMPGRKEKRERGREEEEEEAEKLK